MNRRNRYLAVTYGVSVAMSVVLPLILTLTAEEMFGLIEPVKTVLLFFLILIPQLFLFFLKILPMAKILEIHEKKQIPLIIPTVKNGVIPETVAVESAKNLHAEDDIKDIAIRATLMRPILNELCRSITTSLSSTTEPISGELLRIRKTVADFLNGMKEYEGEVIGHATLFRIENESKELKSDLALLSETVQGVFSILDKQFTQLKTVSDQIAEIAANITNVSANIHVLSINASIEAARAGEVGRGFRVIASEVKVLSGKTEKHLSEINDTMVQSQKIFENIGTCLSENKSKILTVVNSRQDRFNDFAAILNDYFGKFESLYSGVENVIGALSKSMDSIAPVLQLHEITCQEIGNLQLVADDFTGIITSKEAVSELMEEQIREGANDLAGDVRKRLTTERELLALKRGLSVKVKNLAFDFAMNNNDIELF